MSQAAEPVETPSGVEYHRLLRGQSSYRWWKPLIALVLSGLFVAVSSSMLLFVVTVIDTLVSDSTGVPGYFVSVDGSLNTAAFSVTDAANPLSLLVSLAAVAIWTPCILLAMWVAGIRPVGRIHSVALHLRWRWMLACIIPALSATAVMILIGAVIIPALMGEPLLAPSTDPGVFALVAVVILVMVPLQAAAEEYVFRGLLMQALGAWFGLRVIAIVLPTLVFALLHNYDVWGILDVAIFGITAAWITWRTGGLESAIVLHAVNNVVLFMVMASGMNGQTTVSAETGGPVILIGTCAMMGLYAWWVSRKRNAAEQ